MEKITAQTFNAIDLRAGTVIHVEPFPRANRPAFRVSVDFGEEIGVLKTSAQVTRHYTPETLLGRQVIGCVNVEEKNIAGFMSQFLLLACKDAQGKFCLLTVSPHVSNGQKAH